MTAPVLAAVEVSRRYRRGPETVHAVAGVSLDLGPGNLVVVQGPSGSGKTTLLNLLAGWESADAGSIEWRGVAVDPAGLQWQELAVVPQRHGLLPELTALENASLPQRLAGTSGDAGRVLAALGIDEELFGALPAELSEGQQQRVAIARASATRPAVLLVDEPTSAQDEAAAHLVLAELRAAAAEGSACLVASHDPIAPEYADEVVRMRDGRLL